MAATGPGSKSGQNPGDRENRKPAGTNRPNNHPGSIRKPTENSQSGMVPPEPNTMKRVQVEIYGQKYNIVGGDNPQRIIDVGEYVNEKMLEISAQSKSMSAMKVAILAALNITDQLLQFHEKSSTFIKRGDQMISLLNDVVEDE